MRPSVREAWPRREGKGGAGRAPQDRGRCAPCPGAETRSLAPPSGSPDCAAGAWTYRVRGAQAAGCAAGPPAARRTPTAEPEAAPSGASATALAGGASAARGRPAPCPRVPARPEPWPPTPGRPQARSRPPAPHPTPMPSAARGTLGSRQGGLSAGRKSLLLQLPDRRTP